CVLRPAPPSPPSPYTTLFRSLHGIIGTLMYAPNCYIVEYDAHGDTLRFLYFADDHDPYLADTAREWASSEMPNSLTFALLRHGQDRKSTRLNSSHVKTSYAVF